MKYRLKQGYGSHTVGRKRYVSGDIIDTTRDKLAGAIRKFEALEPEPPPPEPTAGLTMIKVDGGFNVINDVSGKVLNDKPLHQHEAEAMGAVMHEDLIAASEKLTHAQDIFRQAENTEDEKAISIASEILAAAEDDYRIVLGAKEKDNASDGQV